MNQELHEMFVANQMERNDHLAYDTPEYWQLRERDAGRRQRVREMIAQGHLTAPDGYFHAALIFQHGETQEDIWQAHEMARRAAEMGATKSMGYKDSRWLAVAALDRSHFVDTTKTRKLPLLSYVMFPPLQPMKKQEEPLP